MDEFLGEVAERVDDRETSHDGGSYKDIQIVGDGRKQWAVISIKSSNPAQYSGPWVIFSGFDRIEAAEVARWTAVRGLSDPAHGSPYDHSSAPACSFEAVGKVLRMLREAAVDFDDHIALAVDIANALDDGWFGGKSRR